MGYKHLGIEKEMNAAAEELSKTDLQLIEESGYFDHPSVRRRESGEYVEVEVLDCKNNSWWYKNLIGFTFMCRIDFRTCSYTGNRYVKEYIGVRLTGTKEIVFRSFDPADVTII